MGPVVGVTATQTACDNAALPSTAFSKLTYFYIGFCVEFLIARSR